MKRLVYYLIICIGIQTGINASLLKQAIDLASVMQEEVKPDNKNFFYPNFSAFYKQRNNTFVKRFFKKEAPSLKNFNDTLKRLTETRQKAGLKGSFVQSIQATEDSTFIIWGDIFGAYHSLVRCLIHLKEQGIIDDTLKIIKERHFLVFNGNVINRSCYSIDTLSLIVNLMQINPDTVFYIKGAQEDKQEWHALSLARELQIRGQTLSRAIIPFSDTVDQFFNSLPVALYLAHKTDSVIDLFRISSYDRSYNLLNEKFLTHDFWAQTKFLDAFPVVKESESFVPGDKKIALRAIVTSEKRTITYKYSEGLIEGKTQEEATSWALFSSPTFLNQQLFDAHFDAFTIVHIPKDFIQTTIHVCNQDIREKKGFEEKNRYNIITTQRTQPGVQAQPELLFGATMDFTKSTNTIGKRVDDGLRLRFEVEQDKGGIKGYQPRILTFDDQYTPHITREKVEFIKNDAFIDKLVGSQGSPSLESYFDYVKKGELLVMFPFTGAPIFRKPDVRYIIHGARSSYQYEGEILAQYAYKELKSKRVAIFYQNDSFGKGILVGAQEYFKDKEDVALLLVPHERNMVTFDDQIRKIRDFDPEAILFFVTSPAARGLITQAGVDYFINKNMLAASVFEGSFEQFINDLGLKFIFTSVVPNPQLSELEIVKEFRESAKKYDSKIDKLSLEMYINASILFDLIERLEGDITKESIIATAENTHNYNLKGLELDFNPQTRELVHKIWIDTGTPEWKEIDTTTLASYPKKEPIPSKPLSKTYKKVTQ